MSVSPLYISKRTFKSLGQQYRVYADRLELQCWILLHTIVVPAAEIERLEIRRSIFSGKRGFTWGIKFDSADLCGHILLTRKSGLFKRIAFTPDDPQKFLESCQSIFLKK